MKSLPENLQYHLERVEEFFESQMGAGRNAGDIPYISDSVRYQFSSGGKRLRPAMCLVACEALGGDSEQALPFALATEILHNFFLIHDDIEDGDTMRRDKATLWTQVGVPNAINVGDYLIAKGYQIITDSAFREGALPPATSLRLVKIFTDAFEKTVQGQALDINLRGSTDITLETYFRIVQLKTAYYLALTWVGGAIVAGLDDAGVEPLWELGRCLGPAFQIRDDILDLTEGKGRGGEIGCDLKEGKPSIFFAYIVDGRRGTDADRRKLIEIIGRSRQDTTLEDVRWAIDFYHSSGAMEFAQNKAEELIARGDAALESVPMTPGGRDVFRAISRYIVNRKT